MLDLTLEDLRVRIPGPGGEPYWFGRFDLDPVGVLSGGWDLGKSSWRTQDAQAPGSSRVLMGRDDQGARSWTFSLLVNTTGRARVEAERFAAAWTPEALGPGEVIPLTYARDGVERVVFGRPRELTEDMTEVYSSDIALITAVFDLADPTVYAADESSQVLRFGAPSTSAWVWGAFDWPIPGTVATHDRPGAIETGASPVAFRVTFTGDPGLATAGVSLNLVGGWSLALADPLPPGGTVTIDTRTKTAVDGSGRAVNVALGSRLGVVLPAGRPQLYLTAAQPTGVSASVSWRRGYRTF